VLKVDAVEAVEPVALEVVVEVVEVVLVVGYPSLKNSILVTSITAAGSGWKP